MDLIKLCELRGVSGRENAPRAAVREACAALLGEENVHIDKAGNVIARKKGSDPAFPSVMLCAHLDEVGLMTVSATEDGLLRVRPIGATDSRLLVSKRVTVCPEKGEPLPGVIGATAIHLQSAEDRKKILPIEDLYVDIGAKDKDEALGKAPIGTQVCFASPSVSFGEGRLAAKSLPSRAGVWNLLRLMEKENRRAVDFVFTTMAELGSRGALGAAYTLAPSECYVLSACMANDGGSAEETETISRLGEGVCVGFMDRAAIADPALYAEALRLAAEKRIPVQTPGAVALSSDTGSVQRSLGGVRTLALSLPARNLYSPLCVCALYDIDAQLALLEALINQ